MRGEARGCRDVATLGQAAGVLCQLVLAPDQAVCERAMQALLALLVNRYPKVRIFKILEQELESTGCFKQCK